MFQWFKNLFSKSQTDVNQSYFMPDNVRVYAIGDVHGCHDLLIEKIKLIREDIKNHSQKKLYFIGLGDYIDRGLGSKQVIDILLSDIPDSMQCIFLKGNHENFMLEFMNNPIMAAPWLEYGGLEALRSYGVTIPPRPFSPEHYEQMALELREKLPLSHKKFLQNLKLSYEIGDYFFAHAGVNPEMPLNEQNEKDLTTIRKSFIDYTGSFSKKIVHGHTPSQAVEELPNRINLDTGAYLTGILTVMVFEKSHTQIL